MSMSGTEKEATTVVEELKIDVEWQWREKRKLTVYVQSGRPKNLGENLGENLIVLTVHDVGTNPLDSFIPLVNSGPMAKFREFAVFLHVCVPGQECGAEDFVGDFPTMEQMAESLPQVLDHFGATKCVAIGEGAGADVVCRFALNFPEMLYGVIFIHFTSMPHGLIEKVKEKLANLHIHKSGMNQEAWDYLMAHKFGEHGHDEPGNSERKLQFIDRAREAGLNEQNIGSYLYSFSCRADYFTEMLLGHKILQVNAILLTGSKSAHNENVFHLFKHMDKEKCALLVAENAGDVLKEAPDYVCQAIDHICQRNQHHLANIVSAMY